MKVFLILFILSSTDYLVTPLKSEIKIDRNDNYDAKDHYKVPGVHDKIVIEQGNVNEDSFISWYSNLDAFESVLEIYLTFPNPEKKNILLDTFKVPEGVYNMNYKFIYAATYLVKVSLRIQHDGRVYTFILEEHFTMKTGQPLSISFEKKGCLGGRIKWPFIVNASSHKVIIHDLFEGYLSDQSSVPAEQNFYDYIFYRASTFKIQVLYYFDHSETLELNLTLSIGEDLCRKPFTHSDEYQKSYFCTVDESDEGCKRSLVFIYIDYEIHQSFRFIFNEKYQCFTDAFNRNNERDELGLKGNCIDMEAAIGRGAIDVTKPFSTILP